jgi:hypothetical protein
MHHTAQVVEPARAETVTLGSIRKATPSGTGGGEHASAHAEGSVGVLPV